MNESKSPPVIIDPTMLDPDTLANLIDSFIMREGTDYGWDETSLETKRKQVEKQLSQKEINIVFDPDSESVTLLARHEIRQKKLNP